MVETTCLVALNMSCLSEGKEKSFWNLAATSLPSEIRP
jgi:hypothetical protein